MVEDKGLTSAQVKERIAKNQVNTTGKSLSKTTGQIVASHIFTLFNGLNAILALLVFITGEYKNMLFMGVIITNSLIAIYQELKAKRLLSKMQLINEAKIKCYRDGKLVELPIQEIVLDDVIVVTQGEQIVADATLLEGEIEVNESLITGESNNVAKEVNDNLYSGSYVVSGQGEMKVVHVGSDNYVETILKHARSKKIQPSSLRDALNFIIKSITYVIVPVGILLFAKQFFLAHQPLNSSILQTVAALVGMIPEGLLLLTTVALQVGVMKIAHENTLVQQMYSLETLARVDMLCLDKTGTLTEGRMQVEDVIAFNDEDLKNILANIMNSVNDDNSSASAIKEYCQLTKKFDLIKALPFSSSRKCSGATFSNGSYIIGAYQFCKVIKDIKVEQMLTKYTNLGQRVLVICYNEKPIEQEIPEQNKVIGLIVLSDVIRKDAKKTLGYFADQQVNVKIISGDDVNTVAHIASSVNVIGADKAVDVSNLSDEELKKAVLTNVVFGRVKPDQKRLMIKTLKEHGYTTAMVGDGVNDVMALKDADCSIAMANGAQASRDVANIVLLDSDFIHLPNVVLEGRRVINNITRTATLFLTKTTFSSILAILTIFILTKYPFVPIQLTMVSSLLIGYPAFVLSLEPNYQKVTGSFLTNVFTNALPAGIMIVLSSLTFGTINYFYAIDTTSLSLFATIIILFVMLMKICQPFTKLRIALIVSIALAFVGCFIFLPGWFELKILAINEVIILAVVVIVALIILHLIIKSNFANTLAQRIDKLSKRKKKTIN